MSNPTGIYFKPVDQARPMTTDQRQAWSNPPTGALVLDTDLDVVFVYTNGGWFLQDGSKLLLANLTGADPDSIDWTVEYDGNPALLTEQPIGRVLALPNSIDYIDNNGLFGGADGVFDISGLQDLTECQCHDNPGISKLIVQGCSALETLDASGCSIAVFDVSGLANLQTFNNNDQEVDVLSLNFSGCSSLTDNSDAPYRCVGSVNLSGCGSLIAVQTDGGELTSLNCDNCTSANNIFAYTCPNLRTITAKNCTACTDFECYEDDVLETLDVSGCDAIEYFDCDSCPALTTITGLGDLEAIQEAYLYNCDALTEISFVGPAKNDFTEIDFYECALLTRVDLRSCSKLQYITSYDCEALKTVIVPDDMDEAVSFDLSGAALDQKSVDAIIFSLPDGFTGSCFLDGGDNATPSAAAIARANILNDTGTVTYNI